MVYKISRMDYGDNRVLVLNQVAYRGNKKNRNQYIFKEIYKMNLEEKKKAYGEKRRQAIANKDKQGELFYDKQLAVLEGITE